VITVLSEQFIEFTTVNRCGNSQHGGGAVGGPGGLIMDKTSDVPGWASSPEPAEPGPFKPKPGPTRMGA